MADGLHNKNFEENETPQQGNTQQRRDEYRSSAGNSQLNAQLSPSSEDNHVMQPNALRSSEHVNNADSEIDQNNEETIEAAKTIATSSTTEETVPKSEDNPVNNPGMVAGNDELTLPKMRGWDSNGTGCGVQISTPIGTIAPHTNFDKPMAIYGISPRNDPFSQSVENDQTRIATPGAAVSMSNDTQSVTGQSSTPRNHVTNALPNPAENQTVPSNQGQDTSAQSQSPSTSSQLGEESLTYGAGTSSQQRPVTSQAPFAQAPGARRKQIKLKKQTPARSNQALPTLVQGNSSDMPGTSHGTASQITRQNLLSKNKFRPRRATGREKLGPAYDRARSARTQRSNHQRLHSASNQNYARASDYASHLTLAGTVGSSDQPGPSQESTPSIPQRKRKKKANKKKNSQQGSTGQDIRQPVVAQQSSGQVDKESSTSASYTQTMDEMDHAEDDSARPILQVLAGQPSDANAQERLDSNGIAGPLHLSVQTVASSVFGAQRQGTVELNREVQPCEVTTDTIESSNSYLVPPQQLSTVPHALNITVRQVGALRGSDYHVEDVSLHMINYRALPIPLPQRNEHEENTGQPRQHEVRSDNAMIRKTF